MDEIIISHTRVELEVERVMLVQQDYGLDASESY